MTSVMPLTWLHTTSLSLNWSSMDLMDGLLDDKELSGWLNLKSYSQQLSVQMEAHDKCCPSGAYIGTGSV